MTTTGFPTAEQLELLAPDETGQAPIPLAQPLNDRIVVMTTVRRHEVEFGREAMTGAELAAGYHFCPDWDYMVVGPTDLEMDACTCSIPSCGPAHGAT